MNLVGVTITRNDDWCLGLALAVGLRWCDRMVVLDHASTDNTPDILATFSKQHPGRIIRLTEPDTGKWLEMDNRQRTLDAARALNASHVAIIDSDELLTDNLLGTIRGRIEEAAQPGITLGLPQVSTYHSIHDRRIDGPWGRSSIWTMAFKLTNDLCWKPDGGYHLHHRHPYGADRCVHLINGTPEQRLEFGGVIHLQHSSYRRLRAKAVYYKLLERVEYPTKRSVEELNRMYDWTLRTDGRELRPLPTGWWGSNAAAAAQWLHVEAEPWQERAARALYREHDPNRFQGIDLHGLTL